MGVEIVGAAATIDTYVQQAWQLFLNGLGSPWTPEAYGLAAIAGMVQWDDVNNVLSVPKDLYNLVSQFAQELSNAYSINSSTEYQNIAEVEIPATAHSLPSTSAPTISRADLSTLGVSFAANYGNTVWYVAALQNLSIQYAFYKASDRYAAVVYGVTLDQYNSTNNNYLAYVRSDVIDNRAPSYRTKNNFSGVYGDISYHYTDGGSSQQIFLNNLTGYTVYDSLLEAVASMAHGGGTIQDNIYVNGNANLDDRVISTDNGAQLELDPAVPAGQTLTLDEVLDAVLDWAIENTWPDSLTISDAFPIALPEPIDTVIIPTAPEVPVPQPILPQNLPIIFSPECESFSACLVAGITQVSTGLNNFYNANDSVKNYANIILFLGLSFVALGVIRRHL